MKLIDHVKKYKSSDDLTITIVSPFISKEFIETLKGELCPVKILVVSDKRSELKIDEIARIAKVEVRLAEHSVPSEKDKKDEPVHLLVHAKLFLFDWKNGAKVFVWGSANATPEALGTEPNNAECISLYKIRDSDNEPESEIELYFKQLWQNAPAAIEPRDAELGTVKLSLPGFSLIKRQDSFDKWLEEGKLFDPETQALPDSLTISLKKDYNINNRAEDSGLEFLDKKTLIFKFSDFKDESVPKVNLPKIKNYAVNTIYGYWLSKEVIEWYIKSDIVQQLKEKVAQLRDFIVRNRNALINEMITRLEHWAKDLTPLNQYFEDDALAKDRTELKREYFQEILKKQLKEHIDKCSKFENDMLKLRRLPRIRFDIAEWENLALSWVTFVKQEFDKHRGHNKVSKIVFGRISGMCKPDLFNEGIDQARPLDIMRKANCWRDLSLRKVIVPEMQQDWLNKLNSSEKKQA